MGAIYTIWQEYKLQSNENNEGVGKICDEEYIKPARMIYARYKLSFVSSNF